MDTNNTTLMSLCALMMAEKDERIAELCSEVVSLEKLCTELSEALASADTARHTYEQYRADFECAREANRNLSIQLQKVQGELWALQCAHGIPSKFISWWETSGRSNWKADKIGTLKALRTFVRDDEGESHWLYSLKGAKDFCEMMARKDETT